MNPKVVETRFGPGLLLASLGRTEDGLAHLSTARELDSLSPIANALEATVLRGRGQREQAQVRLARAFEIDADFWAAHLAQARFHLADGQHEQALASARRADALADGSSQSAAFTGALLAQVGRRGEARQVLLRMVALSRQRCLRPTSRAEVHTALGETCPARDALERAYALRDSRLVTFEVDRRWSALRPDPRFAALPRRMKLDG